MPATGTQQAQRAQGAEDPAAARAETVSQERVAGRVVSATDGHPLARASLTLSETRTGRILLTTRCDGEGRFRFDPLPAGKYALRASATGFIPAAYQEHEQFSTAIVVGKGFATEALEMRLVPGASIRGRVTDASGEPVERAQLTLFQIRPEAEGLAGEAGQGGGEAGEVAGEPGAGRVRRFQGQGIEADGSFAFEAVPPGRYYLSANGTPWYAVHPRMESEGAVMPYRASVDPALDVAYPEVFYPHALVPEEATPLQIRAGERVRADLQMQAERAVTLTLRVPAQEAGQPGRGRQFPQVMRSVFGEMEPVQAGGMEGGERELRLTGLAPGRYSLQTFGAPGRFAQDGGAVDLSNGSATMDAPSAIAGGGMASVHVTVRSRTGEAVPAQTQILLRDVRRGRRNNGQNGPALAVSEKGEVEVPELPAGEYRVMVFRAGRSQQVTALAVDGKAVADKRLRVTDGGAAKADVTVGGQAVAVEGFVRREGKPVAGSMVVLVPAVADMSALLFRRDQSDMDGSFTLPNVLPGNYILLAIEEGWGLRWNDASALGKYLGQGTPVSVAEDGGRVLAVREGVVAQGK